MQKLTFTPFKIGVQYPKKNRLKSVLSPYLLDNDIPKQQMVALKIA
jgi:hypothetical protein